MKKCLQCGNLFEPKRADARYCSQACKQAAYRRRENPEIGSTEQRHNAAQKAVHTKHSTTIAFDCEECGRRAYRSGAAGLQQYCSQACKQRAYRRRKAESVEKFERLQAEYEALPLADLLRELGTAYREQRGYYWIYKEAQIVKRDGGIFLEPVIGAGVHFIPDEQTMRRYLIDYLATGAPNHAMRRQR